MWRLPQIVSVICLDQSHFMKQIELDDANWLVFNEKRFENLLGQASSSNFYH